MLRFRYICMCLCLSCMVVSDAQADQAERLYFKAMKLFRSKQWDASQKAFKRTLVLLSKRAPKGKKQRVLLQLGRCDLLYHLALLAQKQARPQARCLHLQDLIGRLQGLPKGWRRWRVNRLLPKRFAHAKTLFSRCGKVPTPLHFALSPKETKLEWLTNTTPPSWTPLQGTHLKTTQRSLKIRLTAKGYIPQTHTLTLQAWKTQRFSYTLKPKPTPARRTPVIVAIKPPTDRPPQKAKKKSSLLASPWLWVGIGGSAVLVAGIVVTAVALQPKDEMVLVIEPSKRNP